MGNPARWYDIQQPLFSNEYTDTLGPHLSMGQGDLHYLWPPKPPLVLIEYFHRTCDISAHIYSQVYTLHALNSSRVGWNDTQYTGHLDHCKKVRFMEKHDDVINILRVTGPLYGDPPVTGEFPSQRLVTRSFEIFFDLLLNKRLSKQWTCRD